jgi:hypothetical protein
MPDHSLIAFRLVKPPSERALSAFLSAYHDNRLYERVVLAFSTLPVELSVKPGLVSHNILLKTLVATGDVAAARNVGDSPRGTLKQWGKPHLKPATKPKHTKSNHAGA